MLTFFFLMFLALNSYFWKGSKIHWKIKFSPEAKVGRKAAGLFADTSEDRGTTPAPRRSARMPDAVSGRDYVYGGCRFPSLLSLPTYSVLTYFVPTVRVKASLLTQKTINPHRLYFNVSLARDTIVMHRVYDAAGVHPTAMITALTLAKRLS